MNPRVARRHELARRRRRLGMLLTVRARKDAESMNLEHITRCICGAWGWLPRGCCDLCGNKLTAYVPERLAG